MADRTWSFALANGESLVARRDFATGVETVYLGPRLVSRSGPGGKPEGHVVRGAGCEARVLFAADGSTCDVLDAQGKQPIASIAPAPVAAYVPAPRGFPA